MARPLRFSQAVGAALAMFLGWASPVGADTIRRTAIAVTEVHFALPATLEIRPGNDERLVVNAEAHVLPHLEIMQRGSLLRLASTGSFSTSKPITISLTVKTLAQLRSTGTGTARAEGFSGDVLLAEAGGSGDILLRSMQYDRVEASVPGSGAIVLGGNGRSLHAGIGGSGSIDAAAFSARDVHATIDGSGDIKVHATDSLRAAISGAGQIRYRGRPRVTPEINGAGSIEKL